MQKIIYIAGDGRSGSTLLDSILANIDNSISVGECHRFWMRFYEADTLCGCGDKIERCKLWNAIDTKLKEEFPNYDYNLVRKQVQEIQYYKNINKIPELLKEQQWKDFSEIIKYYYKQIFELSNCELIIDSSKSIGWCYFLQNLNYFDLRIIHLERNLASVGNSWKKKVLLPEYYDKEVFMPIKSNMVILKSWLKIKYSARYLKTNKYYLFVSYEAFCRETDHWLAKVKAFIQEDFNTNNLLMKPTHSIGGNPMRSQSNKKIIVSNRKEQHKHLSYFERIVFKSIDNIASFLLK